MSDLDSYIRSWRHSAANAVGDRTELLDELEAHLREAFERLTAAGQSPGQAWETALKQLGSTGELAQEFSKLRSRLWLPAWIAIGTQALVVVALIVFIAARLSAGRFQPLLAAHILCIAAGYAAMFVVGFLGACAALTRTVADWNDARDASLRFAGARLAMFAAIATLIGTVLGAWWSQEHLGRWWGWDPREIGGLCVFLWASVLWQCFRLRNLTAPLRLCIAVTGNMVVALAWFGPALLADGKIHEHAASPLGMALGAFLVLQIMLVYLSLLPGGILRAGLPGTQ